METEVDIKALIVGGASLRKETVNLPLIECKTSVLDLPGQQTVEVFWKGELQSTSSCLLSIDEGVNGIDCLSVIEIEVPVDSWEDLDIFDGEVLKEGTLLSRDVHMLEHGSDKSVALWESGQFRKLAKTEQSDFPETAVLKTLLGALR